MAPRPITRNLQKWEQIGFTVNISVCLELQGSVTADALKKCIACLQSEHPYLRLGVSFSEAGVAQFVELERPEVKLTTGKACFPVWQARLQEFANEFRDWSESMLYAELATTGEKHQLYLTVNHAGKLVAISSFAVIKLVGQRHRTYSSLRLSQESTEWRS